MQKTKFKNFLLIFGLLFACICTATPAFAVTNDDYESAYPEGIESQLEMSTYDCYRNIVTNKTAKDCVDILNGTKFKEMDLEAAMEQLFGATKAVGVALLVVFFLIELLERSTKQEYTLETLLRMLIKYFLMKAVMDNGVDILKAMLGISDALIGSVANAGVSESQLNFLNNIGKQIADSRMMFCYVLLLFGFVINMFYQLIGLVISAACYGRLFMIVIRGGFMPIGCASMVQDGFTGHGLRYLKKYFAACIQGVVIVAILFVGSKMTSAVFAFVAGGGATGGIAADNVMALIGAAFSSLLIPITEVMAILKAEQVSNEIAGI